MPEQPESAPAPIQQTLHGYADGHRLLASSVRLPKDAERLILILSDLSGSTGGGQFDPYLTGYPVASAGYYALARTWPAPEMPRPGCVWTHTLLIEEELLSGVIRPEQLLPLFRRPTASGHGDYQNPIPVPEEFGDRCARPEPSAAVEPALAEELMRALYSSSDPRTVLVVPRYAVADNPLLSIWRLQWGNLRRRVSFCGGSRGPRTLGGEPFILQASLEKDLWRFDRGPTPPSVVAWAIGAGSASEDWVHEAAAACVAPENGSLSAFLSRVGRELPGDTALFRPVVNAYITLGSMRNSATVAQLVDLTAEEYPEAGMGSEFKRTFLSAGNPAELDEVAVLRGLAATKQHKAFDAEELDVRTRSAALWKNPEQAREFLSDLLSLPRTPISEAAIEGLVAALPVASIGRVLEASIEVAVAVFSRNPILATRPEVWSAGPEQQVRAAAALAVCREAVVATADEIIRAALNETADPTSPNLVEVFGGASVSTVMDWADAETRRLSRIPPGWRSALANHPVQIAEWLNSRSSVRAETVSFALAIFGDDALKSDPAGMTAFAKHFPREGPSSDAVLTSIAGRLLRVALVSELPEAIDLASATLDLVYHAAAESRLPDDVWNRLTHHLPEGYWLGWWDRCYRLRAGIAEKFRSGLWPAAKLTDVTRDDAIFRGIVDELKGRRSGRQILADAARTTGSPSRRELMQSD